MEEIKKMIDENIGKYFKNTNTSQDNNDVIEIEDEVNINI
jgi:hypothetical protein